MPLLYLHFGLYPGPDDVGLVGKLAAQVVVRLLLGQLLLQGPVTLGHQLFHLKHTPDGGASQHSTHILIAAAMPQG